MISLSFSERLSDVLFLVLELPMGCAIFYSPKSSHFDFTPDSGHNSGRNLAAMDNIYFREMLLAALFLLMELAARCAVLQYITF